MKYPRLAITVMAAVHLLLFVLLLHAGNVVLLLHADIDDLQRADWFIFSCMAIFLSQGCLLGLWAALGGKPTPWRVTAVVIVAATWVWRIKQPAELTGIAAIVLLGQTFQVMGVLLVARFLGLRLSNADEDHVGHLQFSIAQALSWMTALAVFMGATHYLKDPLAEYFGRSVMPTTASALAVGLAAVWLICGTRWIALRCFTLLIVIGLGLAWIGPQPFPGWPWSCVLLVCEAVVTAASLVVVRLAGYRLVWHWHFRRSKELPC